MQSFGHGPRNRLTKKSTSSLQSTLSTPSQRYSPHVLTPFSCMRFLITSYCPFPDRSKKLRKGQIPKWPTGEDCKSSGFAFTGSNPVLPILSIAGSALRFACAYGGGCRKSQHALPLFKKEVLLLF